MNLFESLLKTSSILSLDNSSVSRGAVAPPPPLISLKRMQNTLFLAPLRLIFAPKRKIAPPMVFGMRIGEGPGPEKRDLSLDKDLCFGGNLNLD